MHATVWPLLPRWSWSTPPSLQSVSQRVNGSCVILSKYRAYTFAYAPFCHGGCCCCRRGLPQERTWGRTEGSIKLTKGGREKAREWVRDTDAAIYLTGGEWASQSNGCSSVVVKLHDVGTGITTPRQSGIGPTVTFGDICYLQFWSFNIFGIFFYLTSLWWFLSITTYHKCLFCVILLYFFLTHLSSYSNSIYPQITQ